ncbi:unnamed protein product [Gadus morhua 'NCC']
MFCVMPASRPSARPPLEDTGAGLWHAALPPFPPPTLLLSLFALALRNTPRRCTCCRRGPLSGTARGVLKGEPSARGGTL